MITMSMFQPALDKLYERDTATGFQNPEKGSRWLTGLFLLEPSETGKYYYNLQQGRAGCPKEDSLPEFLELLKASGFEYSYTTPAENPEDYSYRFVIEKTNKVLPPTLDEIRQATERKQKKLADERLNQKKHELQYLREQVGKFHVITAIQEAAYKGASSVDVQVLNAENAIKVTGYNVLMYHTLKLLALEGYQVNQKGDILTVDWSAEKSRPPQMDKSLL